jgi:hypothetical protein
MYSKAFDSCAYSYAQAILFFCSFLAVTNDDAYGEAEV